MEKIPMTAAGYSVLETELKHRQQVERPRIIQQITEARTHGDLSENRFPTLGSCPWQRARHQALPPK